MGSTTLTHPKAKKHTLLNTPHVSLPPPAPSTIRDNHFTLLASNNCAHSPFRLLSALSNSAHPLPQAESSLLISPTMLRSEERFFESLCLSAFMFSPLFPSSQLKRSPSPGPPREVTAPPTHSKSRIQKEGSTYSLVYFTSSTHMLLNQFFHLLPFPITAVNWHSELFPAFLWDFPTLLPPL